MDATASLQRIARLFEQLRADRLDVLAQIYASHATFQDPFNRVQGIDAITAQFAHMYAKLHAPRFAVHEIVAQREVGWMAWDFHFALRARARQHTLAGATRFVLDAHGLVIDHRDYWDACEFYAAIPVLGAVVRRLKKAAAARALGAP